MADEWSWIPNAAKQWGIPIPAADDGYNNEPMPQQQQYTPVYNVEYWKRLKYRPKWNDPVVPMYSPAQLKNQKRVTVSQVQMSKRAYPFAPSAASSNKRQSLTTAQQVYLLGAPARRAAALARQAQLRSASSRSRSSQYESNYVDTPLATYANDTTGSVTLLNTVAQGASINQRIGKKFVMTSLQVRGRCYNGSTASINNIVNLIVYDKRPGSSLPAVNDILDSANTHSFNKDINSGRFKIIRRFDTMLVGAPSATTGTASSGKNLDLFIKMNLPVVNNAAGTGAIGDIEEGALYFVTVGENVAGNTAATTHCGFRLRFKDQ